MQFIEPKRLPQAPTKRNQWCLLSPSWPPNWPAECGSSTPVNTKKSVLKRRPTAGWPSGIPKQVPVGFAAARWASMRNSASGKPPPWTGKAPHIGKKLGSSEWKAILEATPQCVCVCLLREGLSPFKHNKKKGFFVSTEVKNPWLRRSNNFAATVRKLNRPEMNCFLVMRRATRSVWLWLTSEN